MKLIHLADLHLGKRVNGFSMIEDQRYILEKISLIAEEEHPDAVLIAGDVYDKSVPSAEAVELFDWFLVRLTDLGTKVFVIAGNHDSAERLSFGRQILGREGVYLSPVFDGEIFSAVLEDSYGPVRIYLLPFVKPSQVRGVWPEDKIETYNDALHAAVGHTELDLSIRNVLVTHQFITGSARCESEECAVGGSDQVDAELFSAFDYVALGHLHGPQSIQRKNLRYAGSPLKYSFSEAGHEKSVTVIELLEKGETVIRTTALKPLRDLKELRGTYEELTLQEFYAAAGCQNDYVHITLTDEEEILHAAARLRVIYPNLMRLDYDNQRTRASSYTDEVETTVEQTPLELFSGFYKKQNGKPLGEQQTAYLSGLFEEVWGNMT